MSMLQAFTALSTTRAGSRRVGRLRELMARPKLDAVLVPHADEHQGEYVPPSAERLRWLTGFSGSAGVAAVGLRHAALFVDGRYTVQAQSEVDTGIFEILQLPQHKLADWLVRHLSAGSVVGFDPWLHTVAGVEQLEQALDDKGIRLRSLARNPIDRIWGRDRPAPPVGQVTAQPLEYAGKSATDKIAELQKKLKEEGQDVAILTLPDSIAWLLNIRGSDVAHNPVPLAFAILPRHGRPELFIDSRKLTPDMRRQIGAIAKILEPSALPARIAVLTKTRKRVRLDEATAAWWFWRTLGGSPKTIIRAPDPCLLPKARKNPVEIVGMHNAHERDGVAMVRFLAWLDREVVGGGVDEITCVKQLETYRHDTGLLKDISFDTISGSGPHGAIVHYRVTEATNRRLRPGELFLIDSGAQYVDGTTDVTRTVAIGKPTREMRERFTLVLKGHAAIATARFPKGTRGIDLDPFARRVLWARGLDYDHGTGHGVGSYLSVHEGPQSISKRGMTVLEPGMIISNEPGYYKQGAYGIRIENLVLVTEPERPEGGDVETMGFETLTLAPIDRRLIITEKLTPEERDWLNAYHARVAKKIGPHLNAQDRVWLEKSTAAM
jgi:Xaa-Pro aminopeptidase